MTNYFEKIDDYLMGRMDETERQAFEKEMSGNKALSDAVGVHVLEHRAVQLDVRDNLRAEMKKWRTEKESAVSNQQSAVSAEKESVLRIAFSRRVLQYAAVILLALGFTAYWAMQTPGLSGVELTRQFYEEPSFGKKGDSDTTLMAKAEGVMEQEKDYKKALGMLNSVGDGSLTLQALALRAHCYYKLGDYTSAATTWQTIIDSSDSPLSKQPAEWNWLLMKLAANQRDSGFKDVLDRVALDGQHQYQGQAMKLRRMLR